MGALWYLFGLHKYALFGCARLRVIFRLFVYANLEAERVPSCPRPRNVNNNYYRIGLRVAMLRRGPSLVSKGTMSGAKFIRTTGSTLDFDII